MAPTDILSALQDPLYRGADTYSGIGASAVANSLPMLVDPYGSTGSNALNVFGGSILAALLGNMAKSEAADTNADIVAKQSQYLSATPETRLAMAQADPKLFGRLQAAIGANDIMQQAQDKATQRQLEIQDPFKIAESKRALENSIAAQTDPRLRIANLEDAATKAKITNNIEANKPLSVKDIADLRKQVDTDIAGGPEARNFTEVSTQVASLKSALAKNDPVQAKAALYLVAKAIDPSVVRGEELKFWKDTGAFGDRAEQYFQDLEKGTLTPQMVSGLNQIADTLITSRYNTYKTSADARLKTLAGTLGVEPDKTGVTLYPAPTISTPEVNIDTNALAELKRRGLIP